MAAPMSESRPPGRTASIAGLQRVLGHPDQLVGLRRGRLVADDHGHGGVAVEALPDGPDSRARAGRPRFSTRFVDGMPWTISSLTDAQIVAGIRPLVAQERRDAARAPDAALRDRVEVGRGHARRDPLEHRLDRVRRDATGDPHLGDLVAGTCR